MSPFRKQTLIIRRSKQRSGEKLILFSGYKFILVHNKQCLSIGKADKVSMKTNLPEEITGKHVFKYYFVGYQDNFLIKL